LYHLAWRYHDAFEPIVRPTFHDFSDDPRTFDENDEMMLGPSLLVAPVVEQGQSMRSVYLPRGADWQDFWSGDRFPGGTAVTRPALLSRPVLFVREGHVIPLNIAQQSFLQRKHSLAFMLFPPLSGTFEDTVFEDDGESDGYRSGVYTMWSI